VYIWADGKKYVGDFKNGELSGKGVLAWPKNERKYVGDFQSNRAQGRGILSTKDGVQMEGKFAGGYYCDSVNTRPLWIGVKHVAVENLDFLPALQI